MRPETRFRASGWRGVALVAITYIYFLIFAQFAFLKRLGVLGVADAHLKMVMGAMAVGGICFSLFAPRIRFFSAPRPRLQAALIACAIAAFITLAPLTPSTSVAAALLIGSCLGLLTVTLVTHLPQWVGGRNPLMKVGLGTGLGYLVCNFPMFFTASPETQTVVAGFLCLAGVGIAAVPINPLLNVHAVPAQRGELFVLVVVSFTALVWLDSAAFFIIQNTPSLKAGTWQGTAHLWTNGILHLGAALFGAWMLQRRGLSALLSAAMLALGGACLLLLDPSRVILASGFYPVGVSLYSVALVAYPSLLAPSSSIEDRGRKAGWIYAVAGWLGSGMGIGMAQKLGRVPVLFVVVACAFVFGPQLLAVVSRNRRETAVTGAVLVAALCIHRIVLVSHPVPRSNSAIERGRQIYISEGCINCHSQYVRPNTPDVLMWGPTQTLEELRNQRPPLIGNRRQGPDLAEVGIRRSALWFKAHFYNPQEVSHSSFMPSYAQLFNGKGSQGDDLIAYLASLKGSGTEQHFQTEQAWQPSSRNVPEGSVPKGSQLFAAYCGTCHNAEGRTRSRWQGSFKRLPPDLNNGPWLHLPVGAPQDLLVKRTAQIVKFGIPGTDMPGHEYLSDQNVSSISLWLTHHIKQPTFSTDHTAQGETR